MLMKCKRKKVDSVIVVSEVNTRNTVLLNPAPDWIMLEDCKYDCKEHWKQWQWLCPPLEHRRCSVYPQRSVKLRNVVTDN